MSFPVTHYRLDCLSVATWMTNNQYLSFGNWEVVTLFGKTSEIYVRESSVWQVLITNNIKESTEQTNKSFPKLNENDLLI